MGGGRWSDATYSSTVASNRAAGKSSFGYTDDTLRHIPRSDWKTHDDLDPKTAGTRESRDSDEHPTSLGIVVGFDETGSMGGVPRFLQTKLPELFGLLLRNGYVEHPQILMAGIGDAFSDQMPLQVGQFESDNRIDEDLGKIALEGNGGGGGQESYELFMYWLSHHTAMDCWEKRGHRGYAFIIGDEKAYPQVLPMQVRDIIGDDLTEPIDLAAAVKAAQETFDVYYLHPAGGSYRSDATHSNFWKALLGQNYIRLDDDEAVCETIGTIIRVGEGVDFDEALADLDTLGTGKSDAVGKALATVGSKGAITEADGPADLGGGGGGAARL